jgi:hypothetical protein
VQSLHDTARKLCFAVAVYNLWLHRNALLHGCSPRPEEGLLSKIRWEVKVRLITKFLFKVVCPLGSSLFVVVVVFLVLCR